MQNETLFRDKPMWSALLSLAVPSVFSILIMVLYNMADLFFIGRLNDTAQIAAVSVVGPVFSILGAVATMLGAGGCAVIAKALGEGKRDYAKTCASLVSWSCLAFGLLVAVLFNVFRAPLLQFLGVTPEMQLYAEQYLRVLALGAPFMLISMASAMLLRAECAIKEGFFINLLGTAVNMVLDPLLILAFGMGVTGAAIATVLGNLTGTIFFLVYMHRKAQIANFNFRLAIKKPQALGHIAALGLPNALSSLLSGLASTFANRLLTGYGTSALAANGAAGKVVMLISLTQMGICMGAQPLLAYNCGAKNMPRLKEALQKLTILTVIFGCVTTVVCTLARKTLVGLFLQNAEAAAMSEQLVFWLLLSGPVLGFFYIGSNFLQASGNAAAATVVSVLRQGIILIPVLYAMNALLGFTGIAVAHTLSDIFSAVIALAACIWQYKRIDTANTV